MSERREKLAVLLADLDRVAPSLRTGLLGGKLDLKTAVRVADEVAAVMFTCDLLTAAAVCDLLRSEDRRCGNPPTAVYVRRDRAWAKLPGSAVLTVVVRGEMRLNPVVFAVEKVDDLPPPAAKKLFGGP